jgi:hypothetical protein
MTSQVTTLAVSFDDLFRANLESGGRRAGAQQRLVDGG